MMLLSRFWYLVLSLLVGVALYVAYLGVGQYNRRAQLSMAEGLASDSQTVRWALQIDSRRRLDAMLYGSLDKNLQEALYNSTSGKDKSPAKTKDEAKKALDAILNKIPPEQRPTAIFAVDRDGKVIAQIGYDSANAFDDFELGGYPAVFDALHGYLRDDTWVLGGRMFRVVARPVEYDVSAPPVGAVVGLRAVDDSFAKEISSRTRTSVIFFAGGVKVAQAIEASSDIRDSSLNDFLLEIPKVEGDKSYKESGRSGLRLLGANEEVGAIFGRLDGDAWELRGGYAVGRGRVMVKGPLGFLAGADDKDKANVPWLVLAAIVIVGMAFGILFSIFEHTLPLKELLAQGIKLRKGEINQLQLARLRGGLRDSAQELNEGIKRVAEAGGNSIRKEADLESILGPTPAQPAMSAFSFPQPGDAPPPSTSNPRPPLPAPSSARAVGPGAHPTPPGGGAPGAAFPPAGNHPPTLTSAGGGPKPIPPGGPGKAPPKPPPPRSAPGLDAPAPAPPAAAKTNGGSVTTVAATPITHQDQQHEDDVSTMVNAPARELIQASATAEPSPGMMRAAEQAAAAGDEGGEWLAVYEEFLRTKKECGEPTDGLTFDKFRQTLRKNRDALIQRHGCKRVKFSVYVKEGRASLKATPVKE